MAKKHKPVAEGTEVSWQASDDPSTYSFKMGFDGTTRDAGRALSFYHSAMSNGQTVHNVRFYRPGENGKTQSDQRVAGGISSDPDSKLTM